MSNDKQKPRIIAEFSKCPVCGSTKRFAESIAAEQREKGLMGDDLPAGVWEFAGPIFDPRVVTKMLVGSTVPGIQAVIDICLDCGAVYAIRLIRLELPKE
jgi:hypothetical protein